VIYLTTRDKRHNHVVYVNTETGKGSTSFDNKHAHELYHDGESWKMTAGGKDEHEHELLEYARPEKKPKLKMSYTGKLTMSQDSKQSASNLDSDKVTEVMSLFDTARQYEDESRKAALESEGFYSGKGQWDDTTKKVLDETQRTALVINEIAGKIDLLSGYQRQNRSDFKFYPVGDGDQAVSEILDVVIKNIMDNNNFQYEETLAFLDEIIIGRGTFNVYVDYNKNIEGEIKIERMDWRGVTFGPHDKIDMADCEYAFKERMFSKSKVEQLWPDKANEIDAFYSRIDDFFNSDREEKEQVQLEVPGRNYIMANQRLIVGGEPMVDISLWRIMLVSQFPSMIAFANYAIRVIFLLSKILVYTFLTAQLRNQDKPHDVQWDLANWKYVAWISGPLTQCLVRGKRVPMC